MIFIDTVYQRVLALANKEQRGYVTPLEFNLIANQAQMAIFEQYFYDLNQYKRDQNKDTSSLSDITEMIRMKLRPFTQYGNPVGDHYQVGKIFVSGSNGPEDFYEARKVDEMETRFYLSSRFHRAGLEKNPIYVENGNGFTVFNHLGVVDPVAIQAEVIRRPNKVEWGYNVVAEKALYNASSSTNFELHQSEENNIVVRILELAGVTINKAELVAWSAQQEAKEIQQQKS
tara:strand:- start:1355 stop:2044 length:690 start_codon:yes stop_codon:yes gene_type:complete